ncbi:MAG TPA: alpha/beta hydrolase-fold protein [Elusimicrobiales bacterium]|nr:alpha/beta hydrolase-fold protein [Elusimicrobiales bacterium]
MKKQRAARQVPKLPAGEVSTFYMDIPQLGVAGRRIWVYLPPGYAASDLRYPVLYMHDGQNLFDPQASFCGEWGVDKAIDALVREKKTAGAIVIGIDNGGVERWNEYSPWGCRDGSGRCWGDKYARFIIEDLKPLADRKFRTLPGRESTGIAGSSLGAIISFYAALKYPGVFSRAGLFSPSFWYARAEAAALLKTARLPQGLRVYMDVGTEEGDHGPEYLTDAGAMAAAFSKKRGVEQRYVVDQGGIHNEKAWAQRFPAAFLWLLEGSGPPLTAQKK